MSQVVFIDPAHEAAFADHPDDPGSGSLLESLGLHMDEAIQFRQFCRNRALNWPDITRQALALGADDPESFARAVGHLTQETTLR